jgi:hypothetical protein
MPKVQLPTPKAVGHKRFVPRPSWVADSWWDPSLNFLCRSYTESILAPEASMTPRFSHIASLLNRASELERAA